MIPERDRIQAVMTTEQIAAEMERGDYSAEMLLQHLIRHHNRLERELAKFDETAIEWWCEYQDLKAKAREP